MIHKKNKKGISVMIGYILLVVFILAISVAVYQWLRSYVPGQAIECPDGVSLFIDRATFYSGNSTLEINSVNNGNFQILGYFARIKKLQTDETFTTDISGYLSGSSIGGKIGESITFGGSEGEGLNPGESETNNFTIPPEIETIYSVRITPTRFQDIDGSRRFTNCGDAATEQIVETQ